MAQVLLGQRLTEMRDAACGYYRSRPLLLSLDVDPVDALGSSMGRSGGYSDGRDIRVVFSYPNPRGASAMPMCGGVGAQYTPTAGWAQALEYHRTVLARPGYAQAIGVVLGGEASVATNGFWAALTIATAQQLPMLFYVEDNGYGISAPSSSQTSEGDIAANLASFRGLHILSGDGTAPAEASRLVDDALAHVRGRRGPCLLRLTVPRLQGHSFQDTQTYKSDETVAAEHARDPLPRLEAFLVPSLMDAAAWAELAARAEADAEAARAEAEARPPAAPETVTRHVFAEPGEPARMGGRAPTGRSPPSSTPEPQPSGPPINMVTAIQRTLEHEMAANDRVVMFGEDVRPKGGVHAVTLGLQEKFGEGRVFDASLSEEGMVGRAVGMALCGLMPVPEIQFREYAEPSAEQSAHYGSLRWRTHNRFAAPMVLRAGRRLQVRRPLAQPDQRGGLRPHARLAGGRPVQRRRCGGSVAHGPAGRRPVLFFEHRAMLDAAWRDAPTPATPMLCPFGRAKTTVAGDAMAAYELLTINSFDR